MTFTLPPLPILMAIWAILLLLMLLGEHEANKHSPLVLLIQVLFVHYNIFLFLFLPILSLLK